MKPKDYSWCSSCKEQKVYKVAFTEKALICQDCIEEGLGLIKSQKKNDIKTATSMSDIEKAQAEVSYLKKPKELYDELNKYVIGQDNAKKILSTAVYQHQKRIILEKYNLNAEFSRKSNPLFIGPTGCGKTLLAEIIAKLTNLPIYIQDATQLTEAGYIGEDVSAMIEGLINKCDGDIKRAESEGIIFIDEIDKLHSYGGSANLNRDPRSGVQDALLKLCEGSEIMVTQNNAQKQRGEPKTIFNTKNVLFIGSGAFSEIKKTMDEESSQSIGFLSDDHKTKNTRVEIKTDDLIKYGMKAEFIGRFDTIVQLEQLNIEQLKMIIKNPNNSYLQTQKMLAMADGIDLTIEEDAIEEIAKYSYEKKIGARGLNGIINKALIEFTFSSPSEQLTEFKITKDLIKKYCNA